MPAPQHYLLKTRFGFRDEDITVLTDDQSSPSAWPTRGNMLAQMQRLVCDARPGDSLVFHYSGPRCCPPCGMIAPRRWQRRGAFDDGSAAATQSAVRTAEAL